MANYNIVVDTSNFKPFDFNATLQVLHDYRDAYDKQQVMLDKIAEAKGLYQITPEMDEEFSTIMDKYNQDFEAAAADFSTGMTAENRAVLDSIRRRYASEIIPIQKAAESYNAYVDSINQLNANSKGNALINNPYKLRDFLGGIKKSIDYRDASTIREEASNIAQGIFRATQGDPELKAATEDAFKDMFVIMTQKPGISRDDVMNFLSTKYGDTVTGILSPLNDYYNNLGISSWTPENQSRAWNAMINGAMSAVPERKDSVMQNPNFTPDIEKERLQLQRDEFNHRVAQDQLEADHWNKTFNATYDSPVKKLENKQAQYILDNVTTLESGYGGTDRIQRAIDAIDKQGKVYYQDEKGKWRKTTVENYNAWNIKKITGRTAEEQQKYVRNNILVPGKKVQQEKINSILTRATTSKSTKSSNSGNTELISDKNNNVYKVKSKTVDKYPLITGTNVPDYDEDPHSEEVIYYLDENNNVMIVEDNSEQGWHYATMKEINEGKAKKANEQNSGNSRRGTLAPSGWGGNNNGANHRNLNNSTSKPNSGGSGSGLASGNV